MGAFQRGRHSMAFLLLCLVDGPAYGLELQQRLDELIPENGMDRAILYRSLNKLEKEGRISVRLDDSRSGPVRKYYTLTEKGYELLDEFEKDIRYRVANLSLFLDKYERDVKKKEILLNHSVVFHGVAGLLLPVEKVLLKNSISKVRKRPVMS